MLKQEKKIELFFNAVLVRSRVYTFTAWIIYLEIFFFLNEFSAATVTGSGFCCHWRQKCWPFQAVDHIFHLILVCSDESKAVISPPTAERVGAQACHPPPFHRAGVNAGATLYEWLFTRCTCCTSVIRLSCCLPTGYLWWVHGWKDQNGLWPPRPLKCVSVCLCIALMSASSDNAGLVVCLNGVFKDSHYRYLMISIQWLN